jgi:hypothetical protein
VLGGTHGPRSAGGGEEALVEPFERALTAEQEHLQKVQAWRAAGQERPELGRCEQARSRQLMTPLVYEDNIRTHA